ncbi:hypothetical protein EJB05_27083 [Eragrostis curvula]|uniref:Chalcone/stilbene synthase N-terminal domain-containing protein n=1 Tax=Eragrostis curvula TaxID=38414 RepID=A0A5J9UMJ6_9POAL|nr:hypothetical protein EJB05_27083 [Eragrostis curvula]
MATSRPVTVLEETRSAQRANGTAAVLAIGTANPVNCVRQDEYADWYFRVTKSDHLDKLKGKMKRICDKSGIVKRYFHHTEELIDGHPELLDRTQPSLGTRLAIARDAVAELAAAAASKAIAEWGRPAADVTHLVVSTNSGSGSPGADLRLAALLGLRPTVQRTLLYFHGCAAGSVALRLAKDLAENNPGARVLAVSVDATVLAFREPNASHLDALVAMALFGDGAGAAVVGAGPAASGERPVFRMVAAAQATLHGAEHAVGLKLSENGLDFYMSAEMPALVGGSIERCLADVLAPLGLAAGGLNGLFWAVHPVARRSWTATRPRWGLSRGSWRPAGVY